MRVREARPGVLQVTLTRAEMSVLVAAARMACDVLDQDPRAPASGRSALSAVLRDYDAAVRRAGPASAGTDGPERDEAPREPGGLTRSG